MADLSLEAKIESILFSRDEPVRISELSSFLDTDAEKIQAALLCLREQLQGRGISLLTKDDEATLVTAPEVSDLIEGIRREELSRDIGKAGLETLAIILYRGPLSRAEIDYIRGVNSTFTLRHLMVRGLVERVESPTRDRSFLYRPTIELLAHLGIERVEELPEFDKVKHEFETMEQSEHDDGENN